jgi:hypothetical protein
MTGAFEPPPVVHTLWALAVALTYLVFIPRTVYLLHAVWRASRSIEFYAREALAAAAGIAGNTSNIPALDATISVAGRLNAAAGPVAAKLETVADVLEQRAGRS